MRIPKILHINNQSKLNTNIFLYNCVVKFIHVHTHTRHIIIPPAEIMKQVMLAWADHQLSNGMIQESLSVGCLEETSKEGKNRSSCAELFVKKVFLEISQNSQENTCDRVSFLIRLQASGVQLY